MTTCPAATCMEHIAFDENKADLARFLSDVIMIKGKDLPERYEMVTGGGFINAIDARSMRRDQTMKKRIQG